MLKSVVCSLIFFHSTAVASIGIDSSEFELPKKNIEVRMKSVQTIIGDQVVLGKVAKIHSKRLRDFQKLSALELMEFPQNKNSIKVPAAYIKERIKEVVPNAKNLAIYIPDYVTFRKYKTELDQSEVYNFIYREAEKFGNVPDDLDLTIVDLRMQKRIKVKDGSKVTIKSLSHKKKWKGVMRFKLSVLEPGAVIAKKYVVRADLRWFGKRWQTSREIGFHEPLSVDDFEMRKVDVTRFSRRAVELTDKKELAKFLENSRAKRPIAVNSILTKDMLGFYPDIKTGDLIKVRFKGSNNLEIETQGAAMMNGRIGSPLRVRLVKTKKVVSGKLIGKNLMEIKL